MSSLLRRLRAMPLRTLEGMRRGIEKESLRTSADGSLALTPHPPALGSALANPNITTDFSESQLELITGVHADVEACARELTQIHQFVLRAIGDEMLWASSMPCGLPTDESIPLGRYGSSNIGHAKSVYRMGLALRYGRRMQTISGIHYNWSLPGLSNDDYFALMRNFRRHSFVLLVLFGASPAVSSSFVEGREHRLKALREHTLYLPHATSLRMGRLGYQSDVQAQLKVSYNSLDSYGASLQDALTRPYAPYEALGIVSPGGEYNQLATTLLQIENEFYSTIRPKRVILPGERPLHALRARGVEYIEVRCMDLDPFEPVGIAPSTMRFLDVFLLHCLLSESPPDTAHEVAALGRNQHRAAERGREPGLTLERGEGEVALCDWGARLVDEMAPIAEVLDSLRDDRAYRDAVAYAAAAMRDPARLPSARALAEMEGSHDGSHTGFVQACSQRAKSTLAAQPLAPAVLARFERLAAASIEEQRRSEAADKLSFEEFRQQYVSPDRLLVST